MDNCSSALIDTKNIRCCCYFGLNHEIATYGNHGMSISDLSLSSECQNIEVILKNKVLEIQFSYQGIYRVYKTVNGKASWRATSQAIWYVPSINEWSIGNLKDIGTATVGFVTIGEQGDKSPSDVPNDRWKYYDGYADEWKNAESGDVSIECWNPDKGTVTLHMFMHLCIYTGSAY